MTLTEFLEARIAEDEAAAGAQLGVRPAILDLDGDWWPAEEVSTVGVVIYDPARVLAQCVALRAVVAAHPITTHGIAAGYVGQNEGFGCEVCHDWDGVTEMLGYCTTLRALATIHADHPAYREEWAL